jgi:hypothetical protein
MSSLSVMAKLTIMANFPLRMAKATLTQGLFFVNPDGPLAVATGHNFIITDLG